MLDLDGKLEERLTSEGNNRTEQRELGHEGNRLDGRRSFQLQPKSKKHKLKFRRTTFKVIIYLN